MHRALMATIILVVTLFLSGCASSSTPATAPPSQSSYSYVGSVNSDKYHRPSCQWANKIKPGNEIYFNTKDQAELEGYKPCKVCKP